MDFQRKAYWMASNSGKRKKKLKGKKVHKVHGCRKRLTPSATATTFDSGKAINKWFFKVMVGSWQTGIKVMPEMTYLMHCDNSDTC